LGCVDGDQALRIAARDDGRRQRAGPAADLQPVEARRGVQPIEKLRRQLAAPAPHVSVIAVAGLPGVVSGGGGGHRTPSRLEYGIACDNPYSTQSIRRKFGPALASSSSAASSASCSACAGCPSRRVL